LTYLLESRLDWSPEKVRAYQDRKLREVIRYCWLHVPYYRDKWRGYLARPEDIRGVSDLPSLPILTKEEVRANQDRLKSTAPGVRFNAGRTGGSTGQPISFFLTPYDEQLAWAQMYLGWRRAGYRFGMPFLVIGGESVGIGDWDKRTRNDRILNRWVTSGSNITPKRVANFFTLPQASRMRFLYGYPNAIAAFGRQMRELGHGLPALVGIVCTAEVMTATLRQEIKDVYGVKRVLDQYGLNDGGLHAVDSDEEDGLFLSPFRGILEVLDDQDKVVVEPGVKGRALATAISNPAMPFIRYDTGDYIAWHSPKSRSAVCRWPSIAPVEGRMGDVMALPSGRVIAMPGLTLVMRWLEGINQYQFVQTGPRQVEVRLDPLEGSELSMDDTLAFLRNRISDEIEWKVVLAKPLLTQNGKLLVLRNDWMRRQGMQQSAGT
jgi:phenylacetate-CoA ligase